MSNETIAIQEVFDAQEPCVGSAEMLGEMLQQQKESVIRFFSHKYGSNVSVEGIEDAFQEVSINFLKIFLQIEISGFRNLLYRSVSNNIIDSIRKAKRKIRGGKGQIEIQEDTLTFEDSSQLTAEQIVLKQEEQAIVHKTLEEIPDNLREMLWARYRENLTDRAIASTRGCDQGTIYYHLKRLQKTIGQKLTGKYPDHFSSETDAA